MHTADAEGATTLLACAFSDGEDRLVSADEPLAGLQHSCGGEVPGMIAVPELLEIVRKARQYQFRLARSIQAHDGADTITAWVEVEPIAGAAGPDDGCRIVLRSWQATPLPADDTRGLLARRALLDREVAELSARLDGQQRVLTVMSESADLRALVDRMQSGIGRPITDFVAPLGLGPQGLHWRMLDGSPVAVDGSLREWRIVLLPHGVPGQEPSGFELLLVSDEPAPEAEPFDGDNDGIMLRGGRAVIGADLAPVLRQPIARIVGNAETIRARLAGPLPDAYAEYATDIANAGRLLLGLLEDLGDLEAVESEGFTTAPDPIDLAEVARQAAGILGLRAQEKGIVVEAPEPAASLPAIAEFRRVLQVLINLVGNAIRYAPEHSRIWISLEGEGARARVVVADQGPGLSPEDQAIVFEKFERLGRTGDSGSGLGLYISRRLARAMGGELSVDSSPGQGARFILEVPAGITPPQ
jgi:signal transduction histidine kinase